MIERSWSILANDCDIIYFTHFDSLKENLGEVGIHSFDAAFPASKIKDIHFRDWVTCWIRYLDFDDEADLQPQVDEKIGAAEKSYHGHDIEASKEMKATSDEMKATSKEIKATSKEIKSNNGTTGVENSQQVSRRRNSSLSSQISRNNSQAFISTNFSALSKHVELSSDLSCKRTSQPSGLKRSMWLHKIYRLYLLTQNVSIIPKLEADETARAYAPTFIAVVGNMKEALQRHQAADFPPLFLIDFKEKFTKIHVEEFMQVFSSEGAKGLSTSFIDIERGLRDKTPKNLHQKPCRLFMNAFLLPLNLLSGPLRSWRGLQQVCALWYFLHVPVRVTFDFYKGEMMGSHYMPLVMDVLADVLVFLNLLLCFSVVYVNFKSRWVDERLLIARHYLSFEFWIDLLSAVPLDWFSFISGAKEQMSSCMRLPKMLYMFAVFRESRTGLITSKHLVSNFGLYANNLMLLHISTCAFFYMGNHEKTSGQWYHSSTWYHGLVCFLRTPLLFRRIRSKWE